MPYTDYYNDIVSDQVKGIYAFFGPEKFIIKSMINLSKKKFLREGLESFDLIDMDAKGLSYLEAEKMLRHLPFASERRLLILRNPDFIDSEKWKREDLDAFFELHKSSEHLLTLLIMDKADLRKYGSKALVKVGKFVEFSKITRNELILWIERKFKERKKKISKSTVHYIADNCGYLEKGAEGDLGEVDALVQILSDATKHSELRQSDVEEYLKKSIEKNVFKWRRAILSGKSAESIYYLQALLEEEEEPIGILYRMETQIKDLYLFFLLKSLKMSDKELARLLGKQEFMLKELEALSRSGIMRNLDQVMEMVLDCDDAMKMGGLDGKLLLQDLAFKMERILMKTPRHQADGGGIYEH